MGFCTQKEYKFFLQQVVLLERMLKEDGLHMIKFWFSIDEKEQAKRMIERQTNPLKQWKLSTVDALAQANGMSTPSTRKRCLKGHRPPTVPGW